MSEGPIDAGKVYVTLEAENVSAFEAQLNAKLKIMGQKAGGQFAANFADSYGNKLARSLPVKVAAAQRLAQKQLKNLNLVIDVDADTTGAREHIKELVDKRWTATIDVDAKTAGAEANISRVGKAADNTIPQISGMTLALAAIGPIGIPAVAGLAGALTSLGAITLPAVGASIGVGALAFHGIGAAVKALGAASNVTKPQVAAVGKSAAQAAATAASGALQLRQAAQGITAAEQSLTAAQRDATSAQKDLNAARQQAKRDLQDLATAERQGRLDAKQDTLNVKKAAEALQKALLSPTSTPDDIQQAQLDLAQSQETLRDQLGTNRRNSADKSKADKAGINGAPGVLAAEKQLADAKRAEKQAQQAISNAVAQQRVDELQVKASAESTAKAAAKTAPAITKANQAMAALSPQGRTFARYIFSLRPELKKLEGTAQSNLLPGITDTLKTLLTSKNLDRANRFVGTIARSMGSVVTDWAKSLGDPAWTRVFTGVEKTAPKAIQQIGKEVADLGDIGANIFSASLGPGQTLLTSLTRFLDKVAAWTNSPNGQKKLAEFFAKAVPAAKAMARLGGSVLKFVGALATSQGFVNFTNGLAKFVGLIADFTAAHPKTVEAILWGIVGALTALKGVKIASSLIKGVQSLGGLGGKAGLKGAKNPLSGAAGKAGGIALAGGVAASFLPGKAGTIGKGVATGASIGAMFGPEGMLAGAVIGSVVGIWKAFGTKAIVGFFTGIWNKIKDFGSTLKGWFDDHMVKPIINFFEIASPSKLMMRLGVMIFNGLTLGFFGKLVAFGEIIGKWMNTHIVHPLESFFNIKKGYSVLLFGLGGLIILGLRQGWFNSLVTMGQKIGGWFNSHLVTPFKSFFGIGKGNSTLFSDLGVNLIQGMFDGFYARLVSVGKKIGGWIKGHMVDPIKKFFGIHSPATKIMPDIGKNLVLGMKSGIENGLKTISSSFLGGLKGLPGKAGSVLGKLKGLLPGGGGSSSANKKLVQKMAARLGWGSGAEWNALNQVIMRESGYNNTAQNPTSSAYGMFQFLDGTWAGYGGKKTSDPTKQTMYGLDYISQRYGDPLGALAHEQNFGWYDRGGQLPQGWTQVFNGTGKPEKILTDSQWSAIMAMGAQGSPQVVDRSIHLTSDYHNVARDIQRAQQIEELKDRLLPGRG